MEFVLTSEHSVEPNERAKRCPGDNQGKFWSDDVILAPAVGVVRMVVFSPVLECFWLNGLFCKRDEGVSVVHEVPKVANMCSGVVGIQVAGAVIQ